MTMSEQPVIIRYFKGKSFGICPKGEIVVVGRNFGGGSSKEQGPGSLKYAIA
jgi:3-isopropylmalate dehydratase small subunit